MLSTFFLLSLLQWWCYLRCLVSYSLIMSHTLFSILPNRMPYATTFTRGSVRVSIWSSAHFRCGLVIVYFFRVVTAFHRIAGICNLRNLLDANSSQGWCDLLLIPQVFVFSAAPFHSRPCAYYIYASTSLVIHPVLLRHFAFTIHPQRILSSQLGCMGRKCCLCVLYNWRIMTEECSV